MATCVFGWPVWSDAGVIQQPTYTGWAFLATLPLSNIADRRLGRLARSTNALAASTTFDIDLGVARAIGVLAILIPNLTKSAVPTIRWTGGTSAGASDVYDSGAVAPWPTGVGAEDVVGMNVWLPTIPSPSKTARYWRCALVDTANVDGYLNIARVIIAGAYTPSINMNVGGKSMLSSETVRTVTDGGAALYLPRPRRRSDVFTIDNLPLTETFANVRKMQRLLGTSGQLFWIYDPSDPATLMYERAYLGVLQQLDALSYPGVLPTNTVPFGVIEEL